MGRSLLSFVDDDDLAQLTGDVCRRLSGERLDATTIELTSSTAGAAPRPARLTLAWLPEHDGSFLGSVVPRAGLPAWTATKPRAWR